ncbi:hypothetical protein DEJ13_17940 (plasmid) [Curtobacterium sp. MCLR17_007]|uniref:hypothetical protein n=1 Tax=Curtobacterium sp. MCLR17_007 TaxID=2175648 RepID=UPI000DA8F9DA|nr:hypothetical protein [Curtobacterium sp. MCLR17_007]WIB62071.1 hypothetical protein DEJ13_17940 [Curtobacterium sp. MCLR17_007]
MTSDGTSTAPDRFWSHVVKGPNRSDCWIWTGAIGDDGYGRFWLPQPDGGQRAMRPQRWLYEHLTGVALLPDVLLLHACDVPLCVHVDVDEAVSHLAPGTHRGNMLERVRRGRHRNEWTTLRTSGLPRSERVRLSRELREAFREHGWDAAAVRACRTGIASDTPTLW